MYQIVRAIKRRLWGDASDCSAATTVEYAVVLGLIVLISMSVIHSIGEWNASIFAQLDAGVPL